MRIAISGITGFVGRHLARALVAAGDEVSGFAHDDATVAGAVVAQVDVLDERAVAAWLAAAAPEVVVHLAGLSHVGASFDRPGDYFRVNAVGTRNLVRATRAFAHPPRLILASSAEVYGCVPASEQPIDEDRPLEPRSPYALSKAAAELLALDVGGIVTRSFNIIGPGQAPTFALPSFARQLARIAAGELEPVVAVGDLSPARDFTHIHDAVAAYRTLIVSGEPGTVYNVASGKATAISEALERLRRIAGVDAEVRRDEARVRPVDVPQLCGDSRRLQALGWRAEHDLDDALRDLWQATVTEVPSR